MVFCVELDFYLSGLWVDTPPHDCIVSDRCTLNCENWLGDGRGVTILRALPQLGGELHLISHVILYAILRAIRLKVIQATQSFPQIPVSENRNAAENTTVAEPQLRPGRATSTAGTRIASVIVVPGPISSIAERAVATASSKDTDAASRCSCPLCCSPALTRQPPSTGWMQTYRSGALD